MKPVIEKFDAIRNGDIVVLTTKSDNVWFSVFNRLDCDKVLTYCDCDSDGFIWDGAVLCSFSDVKDVRHAREAEVVKLYGYILKNYIKENSDWHKYFTDSTYNEIRDWFMLKCNLTTVEYWPDFVDKFVNYAWVILCKMTDNYDESKEMNNGIEHISPEAVIINYLDLIQECVHQIMTDVQKNVLPAKNTLYQLNDSINELREYIITSCNVKEIE
jgi:hypothetical protein